MLTITNCSLSARMVISCLTTCCTQRTEFICCCGAEKPQTMVKFWLYKSKMQKLHIKLRLITRFRQELYNPAQGDGLASPHSSVRTTTTYLSTCSLGPSTHHWAPCWMCSCSTPQLEKHSQVITPPSDFEIFCINPRLERYF